MLAFGDSSYGSFCGHGRRLDRRLEELEAVQLAPRTDCEPDYEAQAGAWLDQVLTALKNGERPAPGQPAPASAAAAPALLRPGRPASARLTGNRLLSRPGAGKEVRRFTFDTRDSGTPHWPDLVAEWLAVTGLNADAAVQVEGAGDVPFAEALLRHLDITRITPGLLRFAADRARDPHELRKLVRPGNEGTLAQWSWSRQAVDVAAEFPSWLFFGEQHRATDFYHEQELAAFLAEGTLTRLDTAFSRDQREKVYVQDRMREHGPLLWSWLQDGACLYVCGDASRMARDVEAALREIVTVHGGLDEAESAAYAKQLAADKRYLRDVY